MSDVLHREVAASRIKKVFEYLKAFHDLRNPVIRQIAEQPWHFWLDELPEHSDLELKKTHSSIPRENELEEPSAPPAIFRVRRPKPTASPQPPGELRDWLRSGWECPESEVVAIEVRNKIDASDQTVTCRFADDPTRPELLANWQKRRNLWIRAELPTRAAMKVFEKLFELYGKIQRDAEKFDLVIGDGVLSWQSPQEGDVYHPLLIQRVQLEYDSSIPEFRIIDCGASCELYTSLFQTITSVDVATRRKELEDSGISPLSLDATAFLRGLINEISPNGSYFEGGRPVPAPEAPTVGRAPVLFLRSRSRGFRDALDKAIESIPRRHSFPDPLLKIVGLEAGHDHQQEAAQRTISDRDVLFGKAANDEQLQIAKRLDKHGAVLVQGPPGTGKSHTIANLIGHLLAHGQSVLVTSHTTKSLKVLREHMVDTLRPLCVNVLDRDTESLDQLKQSVRGIVARLNSDADELDQQADRLYQRRNELTEEYERLLHEMCKARSDEYRPIVIAGHAIQPIEAARRVAEGRGKHDWIPGPVALGEPAPITPKEAVDLYGTNGLISLEAENTAFGSLPSEDLIPTPAEFQNAIEAAKVKLDSRFWPQMSLLAGREIDVRRLLADIRKFVEEFRKADKLRLAAVIGGMDAKSRLPWDELITAAKSIRKMVVDTRADMIKFRPTINDSLDVVAQLRVVGEIREHLRSGGQIKEFGPFLVRRVRKAWRDAYDPWRVGGRIPETLDELGAIEQLLTMHVKRAELVAQWHRLMDEYGVKTSAMPDSAEKVILNLSPSLSDSLNWWKAHWPPIVVELRSLGFDWNRFLKTQPPSFGNRDIALLRVQLADGGLSKQLENAAHRASSFAVEQKLANAQKELHSYDRAEAVALHEAIQRSDPAEYQVAYDRYLSAVNLQKIASVRHELLGRLERQSSSGGFAKAWASEVRKRAGIHGKPTPPGDASAAWVWRQLNDELDRRATVDIGDLGDRIAAVQTELRRTTVELIDRRAWSRQIRRTSNKQRQALMGWLNALARIGAGYGKMVASYRREAQNLMEECRNAVPVWIMPIFRLVEAFDFGKQCFDVVIVDEASQCDVMAAVAFALGKRVVIVGDDEQVSPSSEIGTSKDAVSHLIREHLSGIPSNIFWDSGSSIYDLAKMWFVGGISLVEHFRCVPDIIQFSNHLCYQGAIRPLREAASSPLQPCLIPYRVEGVREPDVKVNHVEVQAIASLLAAAIERPEYQGMTFGVISLLGTEQAGEIEKVLLQNIAPDEYERRRIVCGSASQFQGDERDVIMLSMVSSPGLNPIRLENSKTSRQRYNVAASRAKNQMWLVYSLDSATDLQAGDIRRRLIEHVNNPRSAEHEFDCKADLTESVFERLVLQHLGRYGYRATPQWQVGCYHIDFVVEGGGKRVALECDGESFHSLEELPKDMERQAILERLGWRFVRIRGSAFFRDPEATMQAVFKRFEEMGLVPEGAAPKAAAGDNDIISALKRRASEIRAEWSTKNEREIQTTTSAAAAAPDQASRKSSTIETRSSDDGSARCALKDEHRERLLKNLDRHRHPAKWDDEPKGVRKVWLDRCRDALRSCDYSSPETVFESLAVCDPGIARGKLAKAVKSIVQEWHSEIFGLYGA